MGSTTGHDTTPLAGADDAGLVLASVEGDRDAFRELFERHVRVLHGYVAARIGPTDADDVVVETFEVAWRRRHDFRAEATSARPWLLGIATRLVQAHHGAQRRWRHGLVVAATRNDDVHPPPDDLERTVDPVLVAAIAQLAPGERAVLVLVALGELTLVEAAGVLEITPVAARVRLHRARRATRAYLSTHGERT